MSWQPDQCDPQAHEQRGRGQQPQPSQACAWQQPGYGQPPYMPPPRRRSWPRRHKILTSLFAGLGLIFAIGIAAAAASPPPSASAPPPAPVTRAATSPAQPAVAVKPRLVVKFSGNGDTNTVRFAVSATWKLAYSYDCSGFGTQGNFAVEEDGGSNPGGVSVNEIGMGKTGTSWAYSDAGTHYLEVFSECAWTMKVYDEGS